MVGQPDGKNKRQYMRLPRPYRVQARELVFPIAKDPMLDSACFNIGKGGLCVESRLALSVGMRLHVSVHIPLLNKFSGGFLKVYENDAEQYFQTIADVSWIKPTGGAYLIGMCFINADPELCRALGKLIDEAFTALEKKSTARRQSAHP